MAPSVSLNAAVTSDEKSTCPGESIKLTKIGTFYLLKTKDIPADLIVIPNCYSLFVVSNPLACPALVSSKIPAFANRESESVVLP